VAPAPRRLHRHPWPRRVNGAPTSSRAAGHPTRRSPFWAEIRGYEGSGRLRNALRLWVARAQRLLEAAEPSDQVGLEPSRVAVVVVDDDERMPAVEV